MSKKLQSKVIIIALILFIGLVVIENIQIAMVIENLEKLQYQKKQTDYLVTRVI